MLCPQLASAKYIDTLIKFIIIITLSVNDVHCYFPLIYDPVSWVKPLHAYFPATLTWPAPYY